MLAAFVILLASFALAVIARLRARRAGVVERHGAEIYGEDARRAAGANSTGDVSDAIYAPFDLRIDPMERLLLVNFADDPDEIYMGFEPQVFDDAVHGRGMLVIAWRVDGRVDVYHQPGLRLDPKTYDIAGQGLAQMLVRPLANAHFEVNAAGVDAYFAFEDALGRPIEVKIVERNPRKRKPFGLLAPMGSAATTPSALPLVWLHDFYFVRRADTVISIRVAGELRRPDTLPLPIDGMRMYFTRYSPDPLIATLNPAHRGPLVPLDRVRAAEARAGDLRFDLVVNDGQPEIARMRRVYKDHEASVTFSPPLPNLVHLADGAVVKGQFTIAADAAVGSVTGVYYMARQGNRIFMRVVPSGGWHPHESKWSVGLIYRMASIFTQWPKTYVWTATVDLNDNWRQGGQVFMYSSWQRTQ